MKAARKPAADPPPPPEREGRQFLHEIVANGRNGLDVDKFDYLLRDARMCGVSIGLDFNRIMQFSKVRRETPLPPPPIPRGGGR